MPSAPVVPETVTDWPALSAVALTVCVIAVSSASVTVIVLPAKFFTVRVLPLTLTTVPMTAGPEVVLLELVLCPVG